MIGSRGSNVRDSAAVRRAPIDLPLRRSLSESQMLSRDSILADLRSGPGPEILIIGAGINGIGVFRDLAFQGVGSLMVDAGDFCSATSSASSRLIHGGIRYLEIGEFALVRESVVERNRLLLDAPHHVRPLRVWVPVDNLLRGAPSAVGRFLHLLRKPGPKGAMVMAIGLWVYDFFGRPFRTMPKHRMVPKAEFRRSMPALAPSVRYVGEFWDARLTAPERLGLEMVAQGEAACPASKAAPYVSVVGRDGGTVHLRDEVTGERFTVEPKVVINCGGARVDLIDAGLGISERLIGGTKGSHLVLRNREFADGLDGGMLYFETPDHRICLAYPLDAEHVLLGTTDIRTDDPDDIACSAAEVDYLFEVMTLIMPTLRLDRDQIVFTYAGIRPLPVSDGVAGAISRDHSIRTFPADGDRPFPVLSLVGGKWTTFRACAEEIADEVLRFVGQSRLRSTAGVAVGGGADFPADREAYLAAEARRLGLTTARMATLFDRYGTGAVSLVESFAGESEIPLTTLPDYSYQEVTAISQRERVTRLADLVLRRTHVALLGSAGPATIAELADVVGRALAWSPDRIEAEETTTMDLLATRHGRPG
jgi:glycerol-3-phosphate dehydrogenase